MQAVRREGPRGLRHPHGRLGSPSQQDPVGERPAAQDQEVHLAAHLERHARMDRRP